MVNIRKSTTFVLGEGPKDVHVPQGESMTIPDMTMPLKTLLERHSRGLEVPLYNPSYSDEEIPDIARMDISEIAELKEINSIRIQTMRSEIAKSTKQTSEAKQNPLPNGTDFNEANTNPGTQS